ncbi:MAG TPA: DUF2911 domain-containing protein [Thermoanaerobaculia bacterium]|nr:DUF2911 domain-containing protein [Thermoanaerobaculia bacterium]
MRKLTTLTACLLLTAAVATAQEAKKPLSPPATAEGKIGGRNITINYSAPSKRERVIMGELVPYGKVWRTGANAATTLTTDGDLMIGNVHVPAGTYSLLTIPAKDEWTLIVSKQKDLRGSSNYDEAQDLGRVKMTVKPVKDTVETFAIGIAPVAGKNNGTLSLTWENTTATVPVMVH